MTNAITDRSKLDRLIKTARYWHAARDAQDFWLSPEARRAQRLASFFYAAAETERRRLWKLARWGSWMTPIDRQLASITGEL